MSAAPLPRITPGFTPVPNSFIENSALITDSERVFALVSMRRGNGQTISSKNWQTWTGLSERAREYAIKGLSQKGLLSVQGRGERARFEFNRTRWDEFVRTADHTAKPKTAGARKPVTPKPGAMVHPECQEQGCKLLRETQGEDGLNLVFPTPIAQPVAQMPKPEDDDARRRTSTQCEGTTNPPSKQVIPLTPTPIAQPVARIAIDETTVEQNWPKSHAILEALFHVVGLAFFLRLLAQVQLVFRDVTDDELAQAVKLAWETKRGRQHSIMLFIFTVPEAMYRVRKKLATTDGVPEVDSYSAPGFTRILKAAADWYRARPEYQEFAGECDALVDQLKADSSFENVDRVMTAGRGISERAAEACAAHRLPSQERRTYRDRATTRLKLYPNVSGTQLAELERKFFLEEIREAYQLPSVSAE
jgi:hypothetical protein